MITPTAEREAFFRAGQVVVAFREGFRVCGVYVAPDGRSSWIEVDEPILPAHGALIAPEHRQGARSLIRALLAGPAAQERYSFGLCGDTMLSCRELLSDQSAWRAMGLANRLHSTSNEAEIAWRGVAAMFNSKSVWDYLSGIAKTLSRRRMLDEATLLSTRGTSL